MISIPLSIRNLGSELDCTPVYPATRQAQAGIPKNDDKDFEETFR